MKKIDDLKVEIQLLQNRLEWLQINQSMFKDCPDAPIDVMDGRLDFNYLTHAQTMQVIKALGGKWDKEVLETKINYTREDEIDGKTIVCWQAEPPPSCRIVEVEEEVPAQPAGIRKVRKLECQPALETT